MDDPWRTDASTSAAAEPTETIDLSAEAARPGSQSELETVQAEASRTNLESVSLQDAPERNGSAKGKARMSAEARENGTDVAHGRNGHPSAVNGHQQDSNPAAAASKSGTASKSAGAEADAEPQLAYAPKGLKAPTQKKIDKSLKANKRAAPVLPTVLSKTRQKDLPPKPREEDQKHLKEYEQLLELSAKADRKKETQEEQRRAVRDKELSTALPLWEKHIVPNWKSVLQDDKLRKMWWSGSMPARWRGQLWTGCIGNGLAIGKSSYTKSLNQANALITSGRMSESIIAEIQADVRVTLPQLKLFQEGGPMHQDLNTLLLAVSVFWKREPSYARGVSHVAAMLLINLPVQDSFVCLVNLIQSSCLKYFYDEQADYMDAYDRIFGTLLADHMPNVYHNFTSQDLRPRLYLHAWLRTLFIQFLSLDCATRIFDIFVLEGDSCLFRVALAVLQSMEARLSNPDRQQLEELFNATDAGAVAVVKRSKRGDAPVWPDEVYVQCGATEDAIFEALEQMQWRETTWDRILQRELPG